MDVDGILKYYFGYDSFRPHQREIIQTVMSGHDALVLMPTGGGKSLCYQIPALAMEGTAVIISPLISLMKDQVEALKNNNIPAEALNSSASTDEQSYIIRRCMSGEIKLLYISPERLKIELPLLIDKIKVSLFAIDEAHCISHWGHDFRPEYAQLGVLHQKYPEVPILALTATADKITRLDIIRQLGLKVSSGQGEFISSFDRPNLSLNVIHGYSQQQKTSFIARFIQRHPGESGIIYCLSRKSTEKLCRDLRRHGVMASFYHAGMAANDRNLVQDAFRHDRVQVICATIAFGMGIDKSNVRWIIHHNLPKSMEGFYQEIGRAGRDGAPAETILFYSIQDVVQLSSMIEEGPDEEQNKVNQEKLRRIRQYAEARICRRRILLNYFNEPYDHDCRNCDVCRNPPRMFDATVIAQKALSAMARVYESCGVPTIIDILRGKGSSIILRNGYDHLKTFGAGADIDETRWRDYLLQLFQMGYVEVAYDHHNALKITPLGWQVLKGQHRVQMVAAGQPAEAPKKEGRQRTLRLEMPVVATQTVDAQLFERLRLLRLQLAAEEHVPAYVIFSDHVLRSMAVMRPTTIEAFGRVPGVGVYKQGKYGEAFVRVIREVAG